MNALQTSIFVTSRNNPLLRQRQLHTRTSNLSVLCAKENEQTIEWTSQSKCWRPTISDVERISWGKPAKKKGTGSRGVPHRLNHDEERKLFDQARRKGFLEVAGSGWRSTRRDSPLLNTYRSLCDARGQVCIVLQKGSTGMDDELVIDLSPLRTHETFESLEEDIIAFTGLPADRSFTLTDDADEGTEMSLYSEGEVDDEEEKKEDWMDRPIYQLAPFCISWITSRSEGKELGKKLAAVFQTAEIMASKSKKPNHVKPGKNRRSGGYGIG